MRALYGTQLRYSDAVIKNGLERESAAVFLLFDIMDPVMLKNTLACSVFHAIGLKILNKAIRERKAIKRVIEDDGEDALCFIIFDQLVERNIPRNRYMINGKYTYPYVKVSEYGVVNSEKKIRILADLMPFNSRIDANNYSKSLRFFVKENGVFQYLYGCNMENLKNICFLAAESIIDANRQLFY